MRIISQKILNSNIEIINNIKIRIKKYQTFRIWKVEILDLFRI